MNVHTYDEKCKQEQQSVEEVLRQTLKQFQVLDRVALILPQLPR